MKDTCAIEFTYTGSVQVSSEDNGKEVIIMTDYLVLPQLKDRKSVV